MWSDLVEELPVGLALDRELVPVVDLEPVEVLVLQRLEVAFADAVLAGALVPGADVDQLGMVVDEAGDAPGLEAAAVVGHDRDRPDLAGLGVGQMLEQRLAERLGSAVQIRHGQKGKGQFVIRYNSLDELQGVLAHIR